MKKCYIYLIDANSMTIIKRAKIDDTRKTGSRICRLEQEWRNYMGETKAWVEKISDKKADKEYTAVYLENEYLKVMVLPELGGQDSESLRQN